MTELQQIPQGVIRDARVVNIDYLNEDLVGLRKRRVHIEFANGLSLSVSWSTFSYSDNYLAFDFDGMKSQPFTESPRRVEMAVLHTASQDFVELPGTEAVVLSYVPVELLDDIASQVAHLEQGERIEGGIIGSLVR